MALHIDVGEIIIDGVKLSENQLFELRLALESELTSNGLAPTQRGSNVSNNIDHTSLEVHPDSSPVQIASRVASLVYDRVNAGSVGVPDNAR